MQGSLSGILVPFLVDTGAGVSLLILVDAYGTRQPSYQPQHLLTFFGVDRHPIQITGLVTVSIMIAEANFTQEFIIADNITAEGILGMDF